MGIEVLPPDINASELSFKVFATSIRFGLGAVKNVGEGAIEAILDARRAGPFQDIFDFCERVDLRRVNRRVIESLIKCGAFDLSGGRRAQLMAAVDEAMTLGQKIQQERDSAQTSLFGTAEIVRRNGQGKLPDVPEWDDKLLLNFEKEAIGFFITGHPLSRYADDMKRLATADTSTLSELKDRSEVRICGMVVGLKEILTKRGDRMAFATVEDLLGTVEVVIFADIFARVADLVRSDEPLVVSGTVDVGEKSIKIMASEIAPLKESRDQQASRVNFSLRCDRLGRGELERLREIMARHRGGCRAFIHLDGQGRRTTICLPESLTVAASDNLSLEVERLLGYNATSFE
jgi:DNA polymerase-3 subunit alpha